MTPKQGTTAHQPPSEPLSPQSGTDTRSTTLSPQEAVQGNEDHYSTGKHVKVMHQGGYVCDTCINVLGINIRWDHATKRHAVTAEGGADD